MMQKIYNQINQNQSAINESLSKHIAQTRAVIYLQSEIEEWFAKLDTINNAILHNLQEKLNPLLNHTYSDEKEAEGKISHAFWLLGREIEALIALYEEIERYLSHDINAQEIIDAFVSICSVMLKELLLLHINIKDALQNNPQNANIEYAPDIQTQVEFIQKYQMQNAQDANTSNWLLPLATAFGIGFMLGGE